MTENHFFQGMRSPGMRASDLAARFRGGTFRGSRGERRSPGRIVCLRGEGVAGGLAEGRVHLLSPETRPASEAKPIDPAQERERLHRAMLALEERMERIVECGLGAAGHERGPLVREAYRLFSASEDWRARLDTAVRGGVAVEAAVTAIQQETRSRFDRIGDVFLRDWLSDLDSLANDVLRAILAADGRPRARLSPEVVIVARSLTLGEMLHYEGQVRGIVLETLPEAGHAAVVAASLQVPVVIRVEGTDAARQGDQILADGDVGAVLLRPEPRAADLGMPENAAGTADAPLRRSPGARVLEALGPAPERSLRAMIGYGLNDEEIARYYGLETSAVLQLRAFYGIQGEAAPRTERSCRACRESGPERWTERAGSAAASAGQGNARDLTVD